MQIVTHQKGPKELALAMLPEALKLQIPNVELPDDVLVQYQCWRLF